MEREREGGRDVDVRRRPIVAVEQVEDTPRVIGEAPAVRKIAHVADARPPSRVLIGRVPPSCIRQTHDVPDLNAQSAFDNRGHNRIADLRVNRADTPGRHEYQDDELYRCAHESSFDRLGCALP